jgi:Kef-type K+ transport system membrane component KefB/nucleotide-binding universal stress UspA family protein
VPAEPLFTEPVAIFLVIMGVLLITPLISEWVRLPGIVGLIIGGMAIGPYGLRLLDAGGSVELLATIGLIYLMFTAGLEVDLAQFNRVRNRALVFGLFTFLLPQALGTALGRWLGMDWLGAILLGSAFSSHTLIAFPVVTRLGIARNEAIAVTVGATVFTDVAAFLVLAVVLGLRTGSVSIQYYLTFFGLLVVYAAALLFGLPRLGKLFFRRFSSQSVEFQFVLVALLLAAFFAERIGLHSVVGAFLAGLAVNAALPHHSAVISRVLFLGEAFFIPVFLMHSGMITDAGAFVADPQTLALGAAVTAVAYGSKLAAAWLAARVFGYSRDELWTVWGLSQAQAAVTIPTLLIGLATGLFSQTLFNAAIMMIVLTTVTSPVIVQRFGPKLRADEVDDQKPDLFERVLVPVANPTTQEHLVAMAALLARAGEGTLLPVHVAREVNGQVAERTRHEQRELMEAPILNDPDTQVLPLRRIDSSIARGILRAALESDATLIVMGWEGDSRQRRPIFGSVVDEVVWKAEVPVLVAKLAGPINSLERIVMLVPSDTVSGVAARQTLKIVAGLGEALNLPIVILAAPRFTGMLEEELARLDTDHPYSLEPLNGQILNAARAEASPQDLLIIPTTGTPRRFRSSLGRLAHQLSAARQGHLMVLHHAA